MSEFPWWFRLFTRLRAIEALHVGDRANPCLNERGRCVLRYLTKRHRRWLGSSD
jgi:hypothetical protein